MTKKNANRAVILILGIFIAVLLFAVFFHLYLNQPEDLRKHGCKVSEGYVWCESKNKCLRYEDELCPSVELTKVKSNLEELRNQFLNWFDNKSISNIELGTISWNFNDQNMMALSQEKTAYFFETPSLSNNDLEKIRDYLLDNGYQQGRDNPLNQAGGKFKINYDKDNFSVVIETEKIESENSEDLYNVGIYCIMIE